MSQADRLAIAGGVAESQLMERAGAAVAAAARRIWRGGPIVVLAGPGNNGGDGFVAARILRDAGFQVTVLLLGDRSKLRGEAADAAARFRGIVEDAVGHVKRLAGAGLVIDALFGAGARLPLPDAATKLIEAVNRSDSVVLAVDLPSGVDGATGMIDGPTIEADETVTFHLAKPGHLLLPGRLHCGTLTVDDIGIPATATAAIAPQTFRNTPGLWLATLPTPSLEGHKYVRGHAVVLSGPTAATGAARLAAAAAFRVGAGVVTVASPPAAVLVNAAHLTGIMVRSVDGPEAFSELLSDRRITAVVVGPGLGRRPEVLALVETAIASPVALVLDADALSVFQADPRRFTELVSGTRAPIVATPHDGEFARIFPDITDSRLDRARVAAERSGAVVILKGADTVVAAPDGRAAIADNAPPTLATAGSGDTLAGLVGGLLAQGMPAFEAGCAAVWIHGDAARRFGPGLVAEDLAGEVPQVLRELGR